jgi:hypothetical protein
MNTAVCKARDAESWKDLYQAAILEPDLSKLPERIATAEVALTVRARELFYPAADGAEEAESLDDAMCILHALRNSLKHRPTAVQSMNGVDYLKSA